MLAASVTSSALEGRTRTRGTSCWKENDVIPSPKNALAGRSPVFLPAEWKEPLTPPRTNQLTSRERLLDASTRHSHAARANRPRNRARLLTLQSRQVLNGIQR